jgi:hypothetical protein
LTCRATPTWHRAFDGSGAKFTDNVQSFSTVEPAIDLTAASPLAFAWLSDQP